MRERGETASEGEIAAAILDLLASRREGATICPSEAARHIAGDWRPLMPEVRRVAAKMAAAGRLRILQGGAEVDPHTATGPVRLALP